MVSTKRLMKRKGRGEVYNFNAGRSSIALANEKIQSYRRCVVTYSKVHHKEHCKFKLFNTKLLCHRDYQRYHYHQYCAEYVHHAPNQKQKQIKYQKKT